MVACAQRNKDLAEKILHYFTTIYSLQDHEGIFWLRLNQNGSLIKTVGNSSDPQTYFITLGKENECYYFFGAACYFFARYMETFGERALPLAHHTADILQKSGNKALSTIWAAKVGPGCTALYSTTRDGRFFDLALPVICTVLETQTPFGYWLKNGKSWITVSAEQCFWLTDITKRL